jgi:inner membrane transporter RhtA
VLVGAGIISVQVGAGVAGRMFRVVSPAGMTGLRLWGAALLLALIGARPAARSVRRVAAARDIRGAAVVLGFGLVLGGMNFAIYQSIARIPLGVAVTIEFLGPLAVAIASSRRVIDVLWVVLAGSGVVLLGRGGPRLAVAAAGGGPATGRVIAGIVFALISAAAWAAYIVLARATGRQFAGSSGLVIAMVIAAVAVTPEAVVSGGDELARPAAIGVGLAVGLLSSVVPYLFELEALRRVPPGLFGIWMSVEPAVAALVGLALLGQALSVPQWLAIGLVMIACAGAARNAAGVAQAPQA